MFLTGIKCLPRVAKELSGMLLNLPEKQIEKRLLVYINIVKHCNRPFGTATEMDKYLLVFITNNQMLYSFDFKKSIQKLIKQGLATIYSFASMISLNFSAALECTEFIVSMSPIPLTGSGLSNLI